MVLVFTEMKIPIVRQVMINRVLSATAAGYFRLQEIEHKNADSKYGNYIDQRQDQIRHRLATIYLKG